MVSLMRAKLGESCHFAPVALAPFNPSVSALDQEVAIFRGAHFDLFREGLQVQDAASIGMPRRITRQH
ncbi:hypothetical protein [Novosphingobium terrae]|uniref:hypothetical protein n=1 Tax=Novosphingobium terrae TaxID=2726189 RepID=UPI00197DD696|nr:hypothetical protein [Novosphingobium terrae]